jgi:hypothetical protein
VRATDGPAVIVDDGRVLFPLKPYEGESYFGFTTRLASWNCFESRRHFLRAVGFARTVATDLHQALNDDGSLAWRMGLSHDELGALVARSLGEDYRRELHWNKRRISPKGLSESLHHRFAWSIASLPHCPSTWDLLVGKCPSCSHELGWPAVREVHLCESCGFDLRRTKTEKVPHAARQGLAFLADLAVVAPNATITPDLGLPVALAGERRVDVFRLIYLVARVLAKWKALRTFDNSSSVAQTKYLAEAVVLFHQYPYSFDELSGPARGREMPMLSRMRLALVHSPECTRMFDRLLSDWEPCRHGIQRLKRDREAADCLTVREAAEVMRIENRGVRTLVDSGLLTPVNTRGSERKYDWLPKDTVTRIAASLARRASVREFSRTYQIPVSGVLQLCSAGLLTENACPFVGALHPSPQLDEQDVSRFVARLQSVLHFAPYGLETVSLEDTFHGIGGRPKPWSTIIGAALSRNLKLYADDGMGSPLRIKDLRISRELARAIVCGQREDLLDIPAPISASLIQQTFSRGEAEQYLNCFPRDLSWLLCNGHLGAELPAAAIEQFGRELISSREIAWRWRVSPTMRDSLSADHRISRCLGSFWPRREVEEHFARLFPQGGPA